MTAVNSDLPGSVVGIVTTNIYDSARGRYLLIPQGARLVGHYDHHVLNGQNRILMIWQRLVLPNGDSMVIDPMPGTDSTGVSGMADRVDYHIAQLARATLLSTLVALGGNLAADTTRSEGQAAIAAQTLAQQASRVGQRIVDRELDVKPTITIRSGMPFNVLVVKDLELVPYHEAQRPRWNDTERGADQ